MNNEYLERAREKITDAKTLIMLASRRARLLALGAAPMVRCQDENYLDVALLEIAEGLLVPTFDDEPDDFMAQCAAVKAAAAAANAASQKRVDE